MTSILYVAYPLLPVSDESAGGAEQMLWLTDREMTARGYATAVSACAGSQVTGELLATGPAVTQLDAFDRREAEHAARTLEEIAKRKAAGRPFDLVHDQSGSFWQYARSIEAPVLATLHLPRTFYRPQLFSEIASNVVFNCVSNSQANTFADPNSGNGCNSCHSPVSPRGLTVVPNGIVLERFPFTESKSEYLLWMGRICEEKGTHVALEVAGRAGLPLVLAGQVYPFSYHQQYYNRCVRPYLVPRAGEKRRVRFVESPLFRQKIDLLRHARALLVTSLCEETSSLVAMEAMACGTPVIGFRRGAIPDIVVDGETGILVDTAEEMAEAVCTINKIHPPACREHVEAHFSSVRMADDYERLYEKVIAAWAERRIVA